MLKSVCNQIVQCSVSPRGDVLQILEEAKPGSKASYTPRMNDFVRRAGSETTLY